ncbi:MAG: DUF4783 domain-containing protein [Paludibacter sp.]|jgi:hypothetical protein|nr:DUF4783 domain-containing protein [Paludibacter sp.]
MKTKLFIVTTFLTFLSAQNSLFAQTNKDDNVSSTIVNAFNTGDVGKLADFINSNIELTINNKNDIYSKKQAISVISDFFKNNKTLSFKILHTSNVNAVSFVIGELQTEKGVFRVTLNLKKNDNSVEILKLIIERTNG